MKKIVVFSIFALVVSLVVPTGVFAYSGAVLNPVSPNPTKTQFATNSSVITSFNSEQKVIVSTKPVALSQVVAQSAVCFPSVLGSATDDNSALINLNQPASCFNFVKPVAISPSFVRVVQPSGFTGKIVVASAPVEVYQPFAILPFARTADSTLPAAAVVLSVLLGFETLKISGKTLKNKQAVTSALSLAQLKMLKC